MEHSYDDDIDDDLNRFCEDMESELNEISGHVKERVEDFLGLGPSDDNGGVQARKEPEKEKEKERESTVAASPWGMSLFSSFASSASKTLASSFSPLAKDLSSISSMATSATRAFSDTLSGAPAGHSAPSEQQSGQGRGQGGRDNLTALAQTPEALEKLKRIVRYTQAHVCG